MNCFIINKLTGNKIMICSCKSHKNKNWIDEEIADIKTHTNFQENEIIEMRHMY